MHSFDEVKDSIQDTHQVYFFTIKPPKSTTDVITLVRSESLYQYFKKRSMPSYHANCISKNDYKHIHGIVKLNTAGDSSLRLCALQRYINRNIGYLKIEPVKLGIRYAYDYINDSRNSPKISHLNDLDHV